MQSPVAALLQDGQRLHLQHGPIDLIIGADGPDGARELAFEAAAKRFQSILPGLVTELLQHRQRLQAETPLPQDPVARRMYLAARPFAAEHFLTPMIAVAGAVADAVLQSMLEATPLSRAYVNNGGDIALHLAEGQGFSVAIATPAGRDLGRVEIAAENGIGGLASSGAGGRSFSLGIAETVTVLANNAAEADVAATLIANAVDLPEHPGIRRQAATELFPDSDLGRQPVVTSVPILTAQDSARAVAAGAILAQEMLGQKRLEGAAIFLQGQRAIIGDGFLIPHSEPEVIHA